MGRRRLISSVTILLMVVVLVLVSFGSCNGGRILHEEGGDELIKDKLGLEGLQRGPMPPSGPSGCTYIPGTGGPPCTLPHNKTNQV
ncbi:hypothetical protein LIER_03256 [Lithospermum erythrorhizon]|uniref:Uncharacterized protein n=1 Tax=Lithospermum erythrorhizon TaxID=34254 RepID=A0AAV3NTS7_LITER